MAYPPIPASRLGRPGRPPRRPLFDPSLLSRFVRPTIGDPRTGSPVVEDPLTTAAKRVAASLIDPQKAALDRAAVQKQRDQQARQMAYAGVIDAVSKLTAGIPESVRAAYANAGQDVSGFAGAITGQLGADAQAAAAKIAATLSSMHAPGAVTTEAPNALNIANYTQGTLNATDLAHEAASRLAEAQSARTAQGASFAQQALASMNATQQEIDDLRAKGLDLEATRPGEIQKALGDLRAQKLQEAQFGLQKRAETVQEKQLERAWTQTLQTEAYNRTNATGSLWVVKGNKIVNTGKPAPGSAAGRAVISERGRNQRAALSAQTQRQRIRSQDAHNKVMEGLAAAGVQIDQQRANAYSRKEARLQTGGFSAPQKAKWSSTSGQSARAAFYGVKNPNFDPNYDPKDAAHSDPRSKNEWTVPPKDAGDVLRDLLAAGVPYSIAYASIRRYAAAPNSRWAYALKWQKASKPPRKKRG